MCNHSHLLKLFVGKVERRGGSLSPCVIAPTPRRVRLPEICGTSASS